MKKELILEAADAENKSWNIADVSLC